MIVKPGERLKQLCKEMGNQYSIKVIDLEPVIYRDFHNGYDVEISGLNRNSSRTRATIYLWKDKREIVRTLEKVKQEQLVQTVESLYKWTKDGAKQTAGQTTGQTGEPAAT